MLSMCDINIFSCVADEGEILPFVDTAETLLLY